jgi:hypothetical protein
MNNNPFTLRSKTLFSVLLVLSAVSIVATQNVSSQQFTTSTFTQTTSFYSASYYTETSTGMVTSTAALQFRRSNDPSSLCYFTGISSFHTNGSTHIEYSASGPMIIYVLGYLDNGSRALWFTEFALGSFSFDPCDFSLITPRWEQDIVYFREISRSSYPATESLDVNLPESSGPYGFVIIAPLSDAPPSITLTVGPVSGVFTATSTAPIPVTKTLTFFTTLEVPFLQANAEWLAPIAIVAVLALGFVIFRMTSKKTR